MQGLLYPSGVINRILQLVIIVWGLIIFSKYTFGPLRQTRLLKATSALVFMYCLYGGLLIIIGNPLLTASIPGLPAKYIYLQVSLRSLLRIYVFYYYASVGYLTATRIRFYAVILLLSLIPQYYYQKAQITFTLGRDEVTNNIGYPFLSIITVLFFFNKKPFLQYVLLAATLIYIIMSMKRGAIAIGLVSVVALIGANIFSSSNKYKFWSVLFTAVLITGVTVFVSFMMSESDLFVYRIEQTLSGDSSARDVLYETTWRRITEESNIFYILFGRGADSTFAVAGDYAHQDWLETLCNNGLVGGVILLCFYVSLFRDACSSKNVFSRNYYIAYMLLFFNVFAATMFSMSIQSMELSYSMLLGYFTYWKGRPRREIVLEGLA